MLEGPASDIAESEGSVSDIAASEDVTLDVTEPERPLGIAKSTDGDSTLGFKRTRRILRLGGPGAASIFSAGSGRGMLTGDDAEVR